MQYPLLDAFLTMLWFFLWVLWIFLVVWIIFDVFRSKDLSGWAKALWLIFIVILPFLGVLVYLIARGGSMHERSSRGPSAGPAVPGVRARHDGQQQCGRAIQAG